MTTQFEEEVQKRIQEASKNKFLDKAKDDFMLASTHSKYSYNFFWLGRPIIQYPQDIVAIQEIIWKVKPDLIIETGIAHGGSLILSASILTILDSIDAENKGVELEPIKSNRKVIGIDIDIRAHNKKAIEDHPLSKKIEMIEGSSIDPKIFELVKHKSKDFNNIMVFLDSNHTHEHVLKELEYYSQLVSKESYCVVFDTIIENLPQDTYPNRPWDIGNNAMTAVEEFINKSNDFEIDYSIDAKLKISVAPKGYLKRKNF